MDILKKNQIFEAMIDGWSSDAAGVCHIDGRAVFVPGAISGEKWRPASIDSGRRIMPTLL